MSYQIPRVGSSFDFYLFNARLGPYSFKRGLDYFRALENPIVYELLQMQDGLRILDVGVGTSILPLYLAAKHDCHVHTLDLQEWLASGYFGRLRKRFHELRIASDRFTFSVLDAQHLPWPSESFDRVYALSSIEHIPDAGDTRAIKEMSRVLRPNGICVVSVPFGREFQPGEMAKPIFGFMRRYDSSTLRSRLVFPSGLKETRSVYFGERGIRFSEACTSQTGDDLYPVRLYCANTSIAAVLTSLFRGFECWRHWRGLHLTDQAGSIAPPNPHQAAELLCHTICPSIRLVMAN